MSLTKKSISSKSHTFLSKTRKSSQVKSSHIKKTNIFILVDGTSSSGKSVICKYFSTQNFGCFQIDNYFNDKRINFDNILKKLKINIVKLEKFMINKL